MIVTLLITFFLLAFLGLPIALSLIASTIVSLVNFTPLTPMVITQRLFVSISSFPMMAIPLFILAGGIMEKGGVSKRLVDFATAAVGWVPGGMAVVVIFSGALFGATTGSSSAAAAAIGSILLPSMIEGGYDRKFVMTTVACGGYLGVIIPPSVPMIVYGTATGADIGALFMAGFLPGIMLMLLMSSYAVYYGFKNKSTIVPFNLKRLGKSFLSAFWALMLPVIILGGIYGGFFTPTETGAVACLYALLIGFFVYKDLTFQNLKEAFVRCSGTICLILFIIAAASAFSWLMAWADVPMAIGNFIYSLTKDPLVFMLLVVILLMIVGCFMDTSAAILILAPILHLLLPKYGLSGINFALVMIVVLAIGVCTPPVGLNLFVAARLVEGAKVDEVVNKHLLAYIILSLIGVALMIFFPWITDFLPSLLRG